MLRNYKRKSLIKTSKNLTLQVGAIWKSTFYELLIAVQQQHSSQVQLGHSFGDLDSLHSEGKQPQSAHFISMFYDVT